MLLDYMSSIHLNVELKAAESDLFFTRTCTTLQIKYASYEYKNNSADRGTQSVPIRIQTNILKT